MMTTLKHPPSQSPRDSRHRPELGSGDVFPDFSPSGSLRSVEPCGRVGGLKPANTSQYRSAQRGFALVVVLLLSSLLVAMLVALVTMTLAESRTVRATAKLHLARAHALVGLKDAVDTLQRSSGRDQCATVPASLGQYETVNPWLVGAYQRNAKSTEPIKSSETITWLTSGNVTPTTQLQTPTKGRNTTVWLARHSVNDRNDLSVKALKVAIMEEDNPLALRSKKPVRTGSFAWWASDESMKAKANLSAPVSGYSGDNVKREQSWQLATASRSAPWKMNEMKALPIDDLRSERVVSLDQLPLLTKTPDKLTKALDDHFHDLTTDSLGVICNASKGGLRRDLSLAFEMTEVDFKADPVFGRIQSGVSSVVTEARNIGLGGEAGLNARDLNWRTLRDYYRLWKRVGSVTPDTLKAQAHIAFPNPDIADAKEAAVSANKFLMSQGILLPQHPDLKNKEDEDKISPQTTAIVPQVVRIEHAISVIAQDAPDPKEGEGPFKLAVVLDPVLTVWNPYNVKLSAEAMRVDDKLPEVHVMIELRQPWNSSRTYIPGDEVYYKNTIFRAHAPSKGTTPPGQFKEWVDQKRTWSIGTDLTLRDIMDLYKSGDDKENEDARVERASMILTQEGIATGKPAEMIFEPGEFAVFSSAEKTIKVQADGLLTPLMKRGWNPDGGIAFDHLDPLNAVRETDEKKRFWLRVFPTTEVRVTVEPYRGSAHPPEGKDAFQLWKDNDPFEFVKNYVMRDADGNPEPDGSLDPRLKLDEPKYTTKTSDGSQTVAYLPAAYATYLGAFTGGDSPLTSFAWSGTMMGNFIDTHYDTRAYHGQDEDNKAKPLPGQGDGVMVNTIVANEGASTSRIYAGLWDWYWKTETDAVYPAQVIQRFNPRFGIIDNPPAVKEDPAHSSGFPCTVSHYQVQLRAITGTFDIIEQDGNHRSFWGPSHSSQGEQQVPLFEVPVAPLLSVGQFQHCLTSLSPISSGYGIGSSWPSPYIPPAGITLPGDTHVTNGLTMSYKFDREPPVTKDLVDSSYFLNQQLFDDYFFSSICPYPTSNDRVGSRLGDIASDQKPKRLPNPRLTMHWPADMERKKIRTALDPTNPSSNSAPPYQQAAAYMMIDGPFNVNSTSVEAWKAVLAGCDQLKVPLYPGGNQGPSNSVLSRLTVPDGKANHFWRGYRSLTDAELQSLAEQIVIEVKARGPFRSMAEFVNRNPQKIGQNLSGTLQAAIDRTTINGHLKAQVTVEALQHAAAQHEEGTPEWSFPYPAHATGPVMAGQVGFLQQGDILQALAPILTVRGDTFKVRTYGEVLNPVTGAIEARAWCEAIVQRMPEYLNRTANGKVEANPDPPWAMPDESSPDDKTSLEPKIKHELNKTLGRAYRVMHLRWLSPDEV